MHPVSHPFHRDDMYVCVCVCVCEEMWICARGLAQDFQRICRVNSRASSCNLVARVIVHGRSSFDSFFSFFFLFFLGGEGPQNFLLPDRAPRFGKFGRMELLYWFGLVLERGRVEEWCL